MNLPQPQILEDVLGDGNWVVSLAPLGGIADHVHVFNEESRDAIDAAILARRPLLVRGEPGVGKSQLARAAAKALNYAFISRTVDIKTEAQDLMWHFDAVRRLAEAQLQGTLEGALAGREILEGSDQQSAQREKAVKRLRHETDVSRFLEPGPLWWAFDWDGAVTQAAKANQASPAQPDDGDFGNGCVLLIDEIDKAETDVPNGLLEALGAGQFPVMGQRNPVQRGDRPLIVMITTNEERALPDAFVRRCFVLHMELPEDENEPNKLIDHLAGRGETDGEVSPEISIGEAHFGEKIGLEVRREAARQLVKDRNDARANQIRPLPGQAEYLDILRALAEHPNARTDSEKLELLKRIKNFALKKTKGFNEL